MTYQLTREEILERNPIHVVVRKYGVEMTQAGAELVGLCPLHLEKTPSFRVHPGKGTFFCHGCHEGGSVIDFVSKMEKISIGDALKKLSPDQFRPSVRVSPPPVNEEPTAKPVWKEVCAYDYQDQAGRVVYQVVRYVDTVSGKKTFKQRHVKEGRTVWGMDGVTRVLYNLPKVIKSNIVWVVEGEKDADTLRSFTFTATCNVGGAGKWMDGYTESLRDKEVLLCGDNDEPGQRHMEQIAEALAGKVKILRIVKVPTPFKDITEYAESIQGDLETKALAVFKLADEATKISGGINIPVYTMEELEQRYIRSIKDEETSSLSLGRWLPSFNTKVRPLVPGEVVTILADTGVGKTMILQNIAKNSYPIKTLLFELELPDTLTFERFLALSNREAASDVYDAYKSGKRRDYTALNHVSVCPKSGITVEEISELIVKTELKVGEPIKLVEIDYIQLLQSKVKKSRYERVSDAAEALKVMAKDLRVVVVMTSQVTRDKDSEAGTEEISIHDGKDSGAIENSSGLVLGVWKSDFKTMHIKILKNTKGRAGSIITANVDGEKMLITERGPISDEDVPR